MKDTINIGCTPHDEPCQQLGTDKYDAEKARLECQAFRQQLRRMFGDEPEGAKLIIKANYHDYGTYYEVECEFDDDKPESLEYALKCESEMPEKWDDKARHFLAERGCIF